MQVAAQVTSPVVDDPANRSREVAVKKAVRETVKRRSVSYLEPVRVERVSNSSRILAGVGVLVGAH